MKCIRLIFAILLVNTCICSPAWAVNEDTPGLSFEDMPDGNYNQSFNEGDKKVWKRYYGFYGAINYDAAQITNAISNYPFFNKRTISLSPDSSGWVNYGRNRYVKIDNNGTCNVSGTAGNGYTLVQKGSVDVISQKQRDPMLKGNRSFNENQCFQNQNYNCGTGTDNCSKYVLNTTPDDLTPGQKVIRIGNVNDPEINYLNYKSGNDYVPYNYQRRPMAERMVYTFDVTENSTLLTYRYAAFIEDPIGNEAGLHTGDERPGAELNVTITSNGEIIKPVCSEFMVNANASNAQFTPVCKCCLNTNGTNSTGSSSSIYKDWTTVVYDLRNYIGSTVNIEVWVHDCILDLYVCRKCHKSQATRNSLTQCRWGCGGTKFDILPMAGGHRAYCYFTAETRKMEMLVDNCPENDTITITAPLGFSHYVWKTGEGVTLKNYNGQANKAYVLRSEVQENMDYICTMTGDEEDCSEILGIVQLAKDPLGAKFAKKIVCDNQVSFINESYITPVKQQDGSVIEPDEIIEYKWTCTDGHDHNYELTTTDKNNTPVYILEYTQANKGRYTVTLDITTKKGCHASHTEEISVSPREVISIDGVTDVCEGESTTLQISNYNDPGNTYTWYTYEGTDTTIFKVGGLDWSGNTYQFSKLEFVPTPGTTHLYVKILRKEDEDDCYYTKSFDVTTKAIPAITVTGEGKNIHSDRTPFEVDICEAQNATLKAREVTSLGINKWTWSDLTNTANNSVSPQDTTLYYITAEANNGCVTKDSIKVNVMKKPILEILGGDEICVNEAITLHANSLLNDVDDKSKYEWYSLQNGTNKIDYNATTGGSGSDSLVVTHSTPSAIGSEDYMYRLKGTNRYGCESQVDKQVVVRDKPSPIIPDLTPICEGENVNISIYGGDSARVEELGSDEFFKIPYTTSLKPTTDRLNVTVLNHYNSVTCKTTVSKPITINKLPGIKIEGDTVICYGGEITLTASDTTVYSTANTNEYLWTDANRTRTETMKASPTTSTTYGVTLTNSNNCSATKNIPVTVNPLPRVIAEAYNGKVCPNGTDTLKAYIVEGGDTITLEECRWYADANQHIALNASDTIKDLSSTLGTGTIEVSKIKSQVTYYAVGKDKNGCEKMAQVTIYLKPLPTITIAGEPEICNKSNIVLTAAGAETYHWYKGIDKTGEDKLAINPMQDSASYKIAAEDTTIRYTVYGVKDGCEGKETKAIKVIKEPTITISGVTSVCYGDSAVLTANGSNNGYLWTGLGSKNAKVTVVPIGEEQTFQVTGYNGVCPGTAEHKITVNSNPTLSIENADPICKGGKADGIYVRDLNGGAVRNEVWRMVSKSGDTLAVSNNDPKNVVLNDTTIFLVQAENNSQCPATAQATVIVYPEPNITVTAPDICEGDEIVAIVDGAATYRWLTWNGNDTVYAASQTGTKYTETHYTGNSYKISVIGYENGCPSQMATNTINILGRPQFSIVGDTAYCENDEMNLHANGINDNDVESYLWSTGDATRSISKNALLSMNSITLTITNNAGCTNETTRGIVVKKKPEITMWTWNGKDRVCENDTLNMIAKATKNTDSNSLTYTWEYKEKDMSQYAQYTGVNTCRIHITANDNIANDSIHPTISKTTTFKADGEEEYNYRRWNETSGKWDGNLLTCESSAEKTIIANPIPVVSISGKDSICSGLSTNLIAFNTNGNAIIKSWEWTSTHPNFGSNHNLSYTNTGEVTGHVEYTAIAETNDGCKNQDTHSIDVYESSQFTIEGSALTCENDSFKLYAKPDANNPYKKVSDYTYQWSPQGGKTDTASGIIYTTTEFTLFFADKNACMDSVKKTVEFKPLPILSLSSDIVCEGQVATINASSNNATLDSILWEYSGKKISHDMRAYPDRTKDNISDTINQSTTFSVTGTDMYGCVSQKEIIVIDPLVAPDLSVTGVKKACAGSNVDLIAATSSNYDIEWYVYDTVRKEKTGDVLSRNGVLSLSNVQVGTYDYIAIVDNGTCDTKKTHNLVVSGNPTIQLLTNGEDKESVTICKGESVNIKVAESSRIANATYTWTIENTDNYENVLRPENDQTCIVTVSDQNSCTGKDEVQIIVNSKPILTINGVSNGETTICADNTNPTTVNLVADGGDSNYTWTYGNGTSITGTGTNNSNAEISVTAETIIKVTGSKNNCVNETEYTIHTKEYPVFNVANATGCIGDYVTLETTNGNADTYTWSWTENNQSETANGTKLTVRVEGNSKDYNVVATKNGCTSPNSKKATVTGHVKPNLTASPDTVICFNSSANLRIKGASGRYEWSTNNNLTDNGDGTATATPNATGLHKYTVKGYNSDADGGCFDTKTIQVTVNPIPNFIVKGDKTVCAETPLTLSAENKNTSDNVTFNWQWIDADGSTKTETNKGTITPTFTNNGSTNTTVVVSAIATNDAGCSQTIEHSVTVKPSPRFDAPEINVCQGSEATVTIDNVTSVYWEFDQKTTGPSRTLPYETINTYKTSGFNIIGYKNGCGTNAKISDINIQTKPTITFSTTGIKDADNTNGTGKICLNASGINITAISSGSNPTWEWNGTPSANGTFSPTPTTTGVMTYTVSVNDGGCSNTKQFNLTVLGNPIIRVSDDDVNYERKGNGIICAGKPITLYTKCDEGETVTEYTWWEKKNGNYQSIGTGSSLSIAGAQLATAGNKTYMITGTTADR